MDSVHPVLWLSADLTVALTLLRVLMFTGTDGVEDVEVNCLM